MTRSAGIRSGPRRCRGRARRAARVVPSAERAGDASKGRAGLSHGTRASPARRRLTYARERRSPIAAQLARRRARARERGSDSTSETPFVGRRAAHRPAAARRSSLLAFFVTSHFVAAGAAESPDDVDGRAGRRLRTLRTSGYQAFFARNGVDAGIDALPKAPSRTWTAASAARSTPRSSRAASAPPRGRRRPPSSGRVARRAVSRARVGVRARRATIRWSSCARSPDRRSRSARRAAARSRSRGCCSERPA